jgi:hypothetical protein
MIRMVNKMGRCPERQRGRTVNPLAQPSQVRVLPGPPDAHVAQSVEHTLGKGVAIGSSPIVGSSALDADRNRLS